MNTTPDNFSALQVPLERDGFLRDLVRNLSGTLQEVIGLDEASNVSNLNREQVSAALVDLKQRIHGDFSIVSEDDEKIVLQTTSCPFEDKVIGRPSLCMMTSNVFGTITAENLGYAKVSLEETIASGAQGCRVVVYLTDSDESAAKDGNEYFKG